jgi:hypothetical protein
LKKLDYSDVELGWLENRETMPEIGYEKEPFLGASVVDN